MDADTKEVHRLIQILVPVFNEEGSIDTFFRGIAPTIAAVTDRYSGLRFEFLFINDGSRDRTVDAILNSAGRTVPAQVLTLSRNFGKEAAITAGLAEANADCAIIIDVDLQDPPEVISEMVDRWVAGAKVVVGKRVDRREDTLAKRLTARWFYGLHNSISNVKIPTDVGDFRLIDRAVIDALNELKENGRFMKGLFAWVGFPTETVEYKRRKRAVGESRFSAWKLWSFAIDGITSFSNAPLVMWSYIGAFISATSIAYAAYIVIRTLVFGIDVPGYASLLVGMLFLGGIQLLGIGIIGEYVGRIYSEAKRRPPYIISEKHETSAVTAKETKSRSKAT